MRALMCIVLAVALVPSVAAWPVQSPHKVPETPGLSAFLRPVPPGAAALASVHGAAACALGDVNLDGKADLLVRTVDSAGKAHLSAVAVGAQAQALWSQAISAKAVLRCAADIDADHIADPLLSLAGEATSQLPGATGVADAQAQLVLSTVQGATGQVGLSRIVSQAQTAAGAADAGVQAASSATATLQPAAAGAVALVQTQAKGALAALPAVPGVPALPLDALQATAQSAVQADILDATGRVVGTVDLQGPGMEVLGLAALPGGALPQLAALTAQASATTSLGAQVPQLALYNVDGSLAWATDLAATTGVPELVPGIGDLNADGVADIVVQTVEGAAGTAAAQLTVVSGLDGAVMFATSATSGFTAALPLGQLGSAMALLQATQATAGSEVQLAALDAAGTVVWSAAVDAASFPANLALNAHTGDLAGFTDLTGDGIPDVAAAVQTAGGIALQVLDGTTGKVAWATSLAGAVDVQAVASMATGATGPLLASVAGQASDLVAVGPAIVSAAGSAGAGLNVTLVRGLDGQIEWTASATAGVDNAANVLVSSAGDLDADGMLDLLLSVAGPTVDGVQGEVQKIQALSGLTGQTLLGNVSLDGLTAALALQVTPGPAYGAPVRLEETATAQASPGAGILVLGCVAVAAAFRRRSL